MTCRCGVCSGKYDKTMYYEDWLELQKQKKRERDRIRYYQKKLGVQNDR